MNGFFWANPIGLWSLVALAAVAALYLFYRRYKPLAVTGLFLWGAPARDAGGGRTVRPPLFGKRFWFDMLAALFLGLALAGPAFRLAGGRQMVVVLDDSFAMRSRGGGAEAASLAESIVRDADASAGVAVWLAGEQPAQLAGMGTPPREAAALLSRYRPAARSGNLRDAVALVRQLYGPGLDMRVITNQEAQLGVADCAVTVHRLAGKGGNSAFGRIWRMPADDGAGETLLASVVHYGDKPVRVRLRIGFEQSEVDLFAEQLDLEPGEEKYVETRLHGAGGSALRLRIESGDDSIADDSVALVAPVSSRPVTFGFAGLRPEAERYFRLGMEAAGCVAAAEGPDLLITSDPEKRGGSLTLEVPEADNPGVFAPPLIVDSGQALCRDVQLAGQPWVIATRKAPDRVEQAYILAGDTPLFWRSGRDRLHLNAAPDRGTIARSPAWPVLMTNIAAEAGALRAGFGKTNYLPGERLRYRQPDKADLALYAGNAETLAAPAGREMVLPADSGLYELRRNGQPAGNIAVLPLYGSASDTTVLSGRTEQMRSGLAGDAGGAIDLTWVALLVGLAFLAMNWVQGKTPQHRHPGGEAHAAPRTQ